LAIGNSHRGAPFQPATEPHANAEGTIKKLTHMGYGFLGIGSERDLFFHSSSVESVSFEELHEGQKVS
jgi:cold shock protein